VATADLGDNVGRPARRLDRRSDTSLTQRFVKATLDRPWRKRIIMIGSMAHKAVLNGSVAYCASKAAVAHMARCLAWELAPKGFDVFVIHPSNTLETPMSHETIEGLMRYRGLQREDAEAYWNDTMIRSTSLTKDHIVETIRYLLSEKAEYLAGAQIDLAGGQR
jgi:NAD(P)-dependent dehydrogenase (short-subunit alcohol dehydrogenase family)